MFILGLIVMVASLLLAFLSAKECRRFGVLLFWILGFVSGVVLALEGVL